MRNLTDRLESATICLAGAGTIKDRLVEAYDRFLADLSEEDFPAEFRGNFAELARALHRERALPGESAVRASVRKLSPEEALRCTALIVRTYGQLAGEHGAPAAASQRVVPMPIARLLAADAARGIVSPT